MSRGITYVIGAALFICIVSLLLKNFGFKGAPVFASVGAVCILSFSSDGLASLIPLVGDFAKEYSIGAYFKGALKIIGIGYASGICKDVCEELGEGLIAKCVSLAGRLEILGVCAPFISDMLQLVAEYV